MMKLLKWLAPLALVLGLSSADAQTWSKLNTGINRGASPNQIGADVGSSFSTYIPMGTVVSGAFSLNGPTATTRGGVYPSTAAANFYVTGVDTDGNLITVSPQAVASTWTTQQKFGADAFLGTANYSAGSPPTNAKIISTFGTSGTAATSQDPTVAIQKQSNVTSTTGVNQTLYVSNAKRMSSANQHASAIFTECQDVVGGAGSWCEGVKAIASATGGSNAGLYGAVLTAGTGNGISAQFAIGVEASIEVHGGSDAPVFASFNPDTFYGGFVATNGTNDSSVKKSDCAFCTNYYSGQPFRTGLSIIGDMGSSHIGVDDTAIGTKGTLNKGLDLSLSTFTTGAILLPNLGIVRARNAANSAYHNVVQYDGSNNLKIGTDATQTVIGNQLTVGGLIIGHALELSAPATKTANYTVDSGASKDAMLIFNGAGSITVTLPSAATYPGRVLRLKTIAAQPVVSASSNVVPIAGGAAGTAILASTAGTWVDLTSDATNWVTTATGSSAAGSPGGSSGQVQYNNGGAFGGFTVSGDATLNTGTGALTLATVNANTGSWGTATQVPQFTVNGKGLITAAANVTITPAVGSITGLGTGVATALAVNVGSAGAFVVNGGALGTPSSGTLTNATGLPISTGVSGLGTGVATAAGNAVNGTGGLLTYALIGTSGATLCLNNASCTMSGNMTYSNQITVSGIGAFSGLSYFVANLAGPVYPVTSNLGLAPGFNFSGSAGEVDFFNTYTSATDSFRFYQMTGASAATLMLTLTSSLATFAGGIKTGSTTLHQTSVSLTNGAAAATGTLTNAPAAGNPTKWVPINDNGTTRYIPAW